MTCRGRKGGPPTSPTGGCVLPSVVVVVRESLGDTVEGKDGRLPASKPEETCLPEDKHLGQPEYERGWYQAKKHEYEKTTVVDAMSFFLHLIACFSTARINSHLIMVNVGNYAPEEDHQPFHAPGGQSSQRARL